MNLMIGRWRKEGWGLIGVVFFSVEEGVRFVMWEVFELVYDEGVIVICCK